MSLRTCGHALLMAKEEGQSQSQQQLHIRYGPPQPLSQPEAEAEAAALEAQAGTDIECHLRWDLQLQVHFGMLHTHTRGNDLCTDTSATASNTWRWMMVASSTCSGFTSLGFLAVWAQGNVKCRYVVCAARFVINKCFSHTHTHEHEHEKWMQTSKHRSCFSFCIIDFHKSLTKLSNPIEA